MVDRADDEKIGVKSTAILFADLDLFVIGGLQILMLVALVFVGNMAGLGLWFYLSLGVAALLMLYHQWLARDRRCRRLLRRVPAQSLHRHGGFYRHRAELHVHCARLSHSAHRRMRNGQDAHGFHPRLQQRDTQFTHCGARRHDVINQQCVLAPRRRPVTRKAPRIFSFRAAESRPDWLRVCNSRLTQCRTGRPDLALRRRASSSAWLKPRRACRQRCSGTGISAIELSGFLQQPGKHEVRQRRRKVQVAAELQCLDQGIDGKRVFQRRMRGSERWPPVLARAAQDARVDQGQRCATGVATVRYPGQVGVARRTDRVAGRCPAAQATLVRQ